MNNKHMPVGQLATPPVPAQSGGRGPDASRTETGMTEDYTRKRLLAIEVLLEEPEEISDGLEAELYVLRDRLQAAVLSQP